MFVETANLATKPSSRDDGFVARLSISTDISVRDLKNYMIKPSDNGGLDSVVDSAIQKVLISDKTLGLFITPQVRKMTPRLLQIYECEICIIPKDVQIYLNISRTNIVT